MAIKMDKTVIIVCSVVGSLGVLSAILGFSAEGTKLTPYDIVMYGDECIYPQNPALGLGVCAVMFLLAAQVTFSAVGGCCGCCKSRAIPSETRRIVGMVCAVLSWIAAVIAWALLIQGAAWNANVVRVTAPDCYFLKDGIFAGAAVLTLAATALGITSFIMMRRQQVEASAAAPAAAVGTTNRPGESPRPEVATAYPLLPQPSKPQHPSKPQGYEQAQVPPAASHSHPQGYGQAQQNPQSFPPPPAPQGNGSHTPKQQLPPHQGRPADPAPPAVACAPEPGEPPPPQLGVPTGQPQVPLPQVDVPINTPQYHIPAPQVCVEIPAPATAPASAPVPPAAPQEGYGQVIGKEVAKAGVRLIARAVGHSFFSDNTATQTTVPGAGDVLVSMMTDYTVGDVVQTTN